MDPYAYTPINASNEEYTYATVGQHVTADYTSSTSPWVLTTYLCGDCHCSL